MSKKYFFIYSLPRSGSAWLSLFFSQPGCFCIHEPLANRDTVLAQLADRPEPVLGGIDTSAYMDPPNFGGTEVAIYVLWRSADEIEESSRRLGYQVDARLEQSRLLANVKVPNQNKIFYKDLSSLTYLEDLWHQIVDSPFDRERAEYLTEMRVERSLRSIVQRMRRAPEDD